MGKNKYHIEYLLGKVSPRCLWNQLTTGLGLTAWFADEVIITEKRYSFRWNREWQSASIIASEPEIFIRLRWEDEEQNDAYFEFKIHWYEMTGTTALEVTDFAEIDEKSDSIELWDSQICNLKRSLGIL